MALRTYPRVIDLVQDIRANGGVPNSVKYAKGSHMYHNIIKHIKDNYTANHKQAMDAAKYFMY